MPLIPITSAGEFGVIQDATEHYIPPNAWTNAQNVRFRDGKAFKSKGFTEGLGSAVINPNWLLPVESATIHYWLYASTEKVYTVTGKVHSNITPGALYNSATISFDSASSTITDSNADFTTDGFASGQELIVTGSTNNDGTYTINSVNTTEIVVNESLTDEVTGESITLKGDENYTGIAGVRWNGGMLGRIPVLNNGLDVPQWWPDLTSGTLLEALPNWPINTTCRVMRVFKNFLIAFDITKDGVRYPQRVKWSHPADGLTPPESWDETDLTKLAGETDLLNTMGEIVDALPMRDTLVIYKEDSVYGMQYTGGNLVFRFETMFEGLGALSQDCVANVQGSQVFISTDDIISHNGSSWQSILDKRMRTYIFSIIDPDNFQNSFLANYPETREVWFCFPTQGNEWPNLAVVWNYVDNTFTFLDLPNCRYIARGIVPGEGGSWDSDTEEWNSDFSLWDETTYSEFRRQLVGASTDPALYQFDKGDATSYRDARSFIERKGLAVSGQDYKGNLIADKTTWKVVTAIWPKIEVVGEPEIAVYVGSQSDIGQPITWYGPYTCNPSAERKVNCLVSGRLISVRFESREVGSWTLHGYTIELVKRGRF